MSLLITDAFPIRKEFEVKDSIARLDQLALPPLLSTLYLCTRSHSLKTIGVHHVFDSNLRFLPF